MSENEKNALIALIESANNLLSKSDEETLLTFTAGYIACKEAGRREAQAAAQMESE